MGKTLNLKVVTPNGPVVEKDVESFTARSTEGEFCVLPGHALLLTSIAAGRMIVKADEKDQTYALDTGFLEAGPEHIHVITDHCQAAGDVDTDSVKEEIAEIEKQLEDDGLDSAAQEELKRKLGWAEARLGVAG